MANMHDCIDAAVASGEVKDRTRAEAAKRVYTELFERYRSAMPDAQAAILAKKDLGEATRRARNARFHAVTNQLQTMRRITALVGNSDRPDLALQSLVEFVEGSGFDGESVASLTRAYTTSINAGIEEFLKQAGQRAGGFNRV